MRKIRRFLRFSIILLLFLIAVCLIGYPFLSNYLFEHQAESVVSTVLEETDKKAESEKADIRKAAVLYNEQILNGQVQQEAGDYPTLLNANNDGVMGVVEIPGIGVRLPIYHGTEANVLEKGVGHLQGTSLPVGGEGTHAVLTGHTGLSSAKLFTDLTVVKEGDLFYIYVLGEQLIYKVDQIRTVLPSDLSDDLSVEKGRDYCTLLTCTPYGANTHRLLVRGERLQNSEQGDTPKFVAERQEKSRWMEEYRHALAISLTVFSAGMSVISICRYIRKKQLRKQQLRKTKVKADIAGRLIFEKKKKGRRKKVCNNR